HRRPRRPLRDRADVRGVPAQAVRRPAAAGRVLLRLGHQQRVVHRRGPAGGLERVDAAAPAARERLMAHNVLPYGHPTIEDDDIAAVAAALKSDFLTTGPLVEAFETAFAETVGARHAVACANGTAALHLAMLALDVRPGEVVIAPSITFLATANCARYVGAEVVFADVDPGSGLMTRETLAEALDRVGGRRLRAVLPVHLRGDAVD